MADQIFEISGKVAIVTGASGGLGGSIARTLARAGAKVALAARRVDRLAELARQIEAFDGRAIPVPLDVCDRDSVAACVETAETELGPISILVNGAGIAGNGPSLDLEAADWDRVIDTNLKGTWLMTQEVARHMARLGHGDGYKYPHDYVDQVVSQEYLPDAVAGTKYYHPGDAGFEREIGKRMTWWEKIRREGREQRNDDA